MRGTANILYKNAGRRSWRPRTVVEEFIEEENGIKLVQYKRKSTGELHNDQGPAYIKTDRNKNIVIKLWYQNGKRENKQGPAYVETWKGKVVKEEWWVDGNFHRDDDQPAFIMYDGKGEAVWQEWYKEGRKHREHGLPSTIRKRHNFEAREWRREGNLHRKNAPARIETETDDEGNVTTREFYCSHNHVHRKTGPAHVVKVNDEPVLQEWYQNDKLHRENGPARIEVDKEDVYALQGLRYKKEDWKKELRNMRKKI